VVTVGHVHEDCSNNLFHCEPRAHSHKANTLENSAKEQNENYINKIQFDK
jgi:hypothetical protein